MPGNFDAEGEEMGGGKVGAGAADLASNMAASLPRRPAPLSQFVGRNDQESQTR